MKSKPIFALLVAPVAAIAALWAMPAGAATPDIYVTNLNGTVGEYTTSGATVNASLINLSSPLAIAVSGSDLFVTQFDRSVGEYTTSGATVNSSFITGLPNIPSSIAVSGSDVFVTMGGSGIVSEYTTSGAVVNASLITGLYVAELAPTIVSGNDLFFGTAAASDGYSTLYEYTTSGVFVNSFSIPGPDTGLAISGGNLFVAEFENNTIGEYTTSGATVNASLITGLDGPQGLAVLGGNLFVVNNYGSTIGEYTTSGALVKAALVTGLNNPEDIVVTPEPSTWVLLLVGGAVLLAGGRSRLRAVGRAA